MRRLLFSVVILAFLLFVGMSVYQILYSDWLVVCQANPSPPISSCMKHRSEALRFIDTLETAGWTCKMTRANCSP